jgi:uncharacterized protein
MKTQLQPIHIPQLLRAPERTHQLEIDDYWDELETLMPVRGRLTVSHKTTYLEVSAVAEVIVTLTCDRCLQQYNHRLKIDVNELIWLEDAADSDPELEKENTVDELVETLPPHGHFNPQTWIYEQLCLELPLRRLCDQNCAGIQHASTVPPEQQEPTIDHRWAALQSLKSQLESRHESS